MNKKAVCDAVVNQMLNDKDEALRNLDGLQEALNAESRSTAGDKHDTGRAMIHREIQQVESTLKRVEEAIDSMLRIEQSSKSQIELLPVFWWKRTALGFWWVWLSVG